MTRARTIGWRLDAQDRERLLAMFPPVYGQTVADHVTLQHKAPADTPLPPPTGGEVVGWADDGEGVQALVVAIGGSTARPDGSTFHMTWSLGPGRTAVESNAVIAAKGWTPAPKPIAIRLSPEAFG